MKTTQPQELHMYFEVMKKASDTYSLQLFKLYVEHFIQQIASKLGKTTSVSPKQTIQSKIII